jgi:EAL domain-containing protein (putative c-di-GMP-specific phosphodiesterase class I)
MRVRGALDNQEFFLQYQPEIELATGRLKAVEALLRWRDPATGVVMPADFLPLAEENGSIIAIGQWVLDRALADLKAWHEHGLDLTLSLNVSARQLQHPELANEIFKSLQNYGIAAQKLRIEINETALMSDSVAADRTVRALHVLGVEIAIDNFGTGYSSLGLVRGFSAQAVKIDRSMVSGCPNKRECAAIVQAVGAMARSLGITVIAGGVETEEERRIVASLGCDRAQGNLIGRPADWARIAKLTVEPPKIPAG